MYILYNYEVGTDEMEEIIADSGCDYRSLDNLAPDAEFVSVPLTIKWERLSIQMMPNSILIK